MIKKVVILGPESTGKSTLCEQLSVHYKTRWVKEFAREYLLTNGTDYSLSDLTAIAKGQIGIEQELLESIPANSNVPVFIDTDMYVLKVWSEFVFNACDHFILTSIVNRSYDLYLLCNTDLPWEKDILREYPDLASREKLFHYYKDAMVNQHVPWTIISGDYEQRLQKAIEAVNSLY